MKVFFDTNVYVAEALLGDAAVSASVDYLISNDTHLLAMDPYEGVRILSMSAYYELLLQNDLLG